MTKFIKTLIVINGLIIPAICCFVAFKLLSEYWPSSGNEESVIVGESLDQAKKDSVVLQGITYGDPVPIYNSTNLYLPVSVKTYDEPKRIDKLRFASSSNFQTLARYSDRYINVLFLDQDYKVIGKLLDKKASISEITIPGQYDRNEVDKTVKNIAYQISFEDTNKDGKLNSEDHHDLYISDLNGGNLTQVTSQIEVLSFNFIKSNSAILVQFKSMGSGRDEHKLIQFAIYDIDAKTFTVHADVQKNLHEIEAILTR